MAVAVRVREDGAVLTSVPLNFSIVEMFFFTVLESGGGGEG
jgi:hypothetical protein